MPQTGEDIDRRREGRPHQGWRGTSDLTQGCGGKDECAGHQESYVHRPCTQACWSGKREHGTVRGPGRACVPSRDTALSSEKQEV